MNTTMERDAPMSDGLHGRSGDRMLADAADRILEHAAPPSLLRAAQQAPEAAGELLAALVDAGLMHAMRAESDGGIGLGWSDACDLIERCGWHGAPVPLPEQCAADALARLAGIALPQGVTTLGIAVNRMPAGAAASGERLVLDQVPFASLAQWVMCAEPLAGAADAAGDRPLDRLSVVALDGARIEPCAGNGGDQRSRVVWECPRVVAQGLLPAGQSLLLAGAAVRCAQIAGSTARVLSMATRYAGDREQFGRPIAKFQAIQQQLALAAEWSAMASMAARLALSDPATALDAHRVACAKQVCGTAVEVCASVAHAVHGAIGVTAEYDLQLHTRRLWTWAREFGSSAHWAGRLGAELLSSDEPRVWDAVVRASSV